MLRLSPGHCEGRREQYMSPDLRNTKGAPVLERSYDEYLAFALGAENYAVDILRVQEIRGWEPVTRVPNAPVYVKGVLNLRGTIVPVIDLRQRLGMPFRAYEKETVVIILRVPQKEKRYDRSYFSGCW